jgi:hypothetical protein
MALDVLCDVGYPWGHSSLAVLGQRASLFGRQLREPS